MLWNSRDFLTKMEVKDKSIAKMRQLNLEILYDLLFFWAISPRVALSLWSAIVIIIIYSYFLCFNWPQARAVKGKATCPLDSLPMRRVSAGVAVDCAALVLRIFSWRFLIATSLYSS